jgi:hypothetical protein
MLYVPDRGEGVVDISAVPGCLRATNKLNGGKNSPVLDKVSHDQSQRKKQEAEKEVRKEAVALAASNPRRPERNEDPDDQGNYPEPVPHDISSFRWVEPATTPLLVTL